MINFYNQQNRQNAETPSPLQNDIKNKAGKASYKKYTDPTGEFGSKELGWGMWYVKNKVFLYKLLIFALVAFCAGTIGYSLFRVGTFVYYDIVYKPLQEQEFAYSRNFAAVRPRFNPAPLEIMSTFAVNGGTSFIDAVSEVSNPNDRYIATVVYHFDFGGKLSETKTEKIMPLSSRPLVAFGLDSDAYPGVPVLVIESMSWRRVSAHTVTDVAVWQDERLFFSVSDFVFEYGGAPGTISANVVRFTLKNETAFGYKAPLFYVGLFQNGALVGVMQFELTDFDSLDSQVIDLRNFVPNLSVSEIKLYPIIDLYDKSVYLPPKK